MNVDYMNSIRIQEPQVMLSGFLLAVPCLYCYFKMKRKFEHLYTLEFLNYWRAFFLFEGVSFLVGGLAHGFYSYFGDTLHFLVWYASVAGVFCFTWGMMQALYCVESRKRSIILAVHIFNVKLIGSASQITSHILIAAGILLFEDGCLKTILKYMQTEKIKMEKLQVKNQILY